MFWVDELVRGTSRGDWKDYAKEDGTMGTFDLSSNSCICLFCRRKRRYPFLLRLQLVLVFRLCLELCFGCDSG